MKKLTAMIVLVVLILTAVIIFAFFGTGNGMKNGYYTVSEVLMGDVSYSGQQLEALGFDKSFYIEIEGNGKGKVATGSLTQEMTYDEKQMTINNEPANYKYENDTITVYYSEYSMSFKYNNDFKVE